MDGFQTFIVVVVLLYPILITGKKIFLFLYLSYFIIFRSINCMIKLQFLLLLFLYNVIVNNLSVLGAHCLFILPSLMVSWRPKEYIFPGVPRCVVSLKFRPFVPFSYWWWQKTSTILKKEKRPILSSDSSFRILWFSSKKLISQTPYMQL